MNGAPPDMGRGAARRTLRVLHVVDTLDPGGAERHVVGLALAQRHRGVQVTVACSAAGSLSPLLSDGGVSVEVLCAALVKRRFDIGFAERVLRLLHHRRPDVVHAHLFAGASAAAAAAGAMSPAVPLVVTEHTEAPWRDRDARRVSRWTYDRADLVMGVSPAICGMLHDEFGVDWARVRLVAPAVPPIRASRGPMPEVLARSSSQTVLLGCVGRLEPEKGVDLLIQALAKVRAAAVPAEAVIIGDGSLRADLEALARRLRLSRALSFLGYRADAAELVAQLDVLVVPSRSEGSPLVVLEGLRSGVAVVAAAVGGIPTQLRDGVDGVLVSPGDAGALARALTGLCLDLDRRRRLAAAGPRRAAAFSHDGMVRAIEDLYAEVRAAPPAVSADAAESTA